MLNTGTAGPGLRIEIFSYGHVTCSALFSFISAYIFEISPAGCTANDQDDKRNIQGHCQMKISLYLLFMFIISLSISLIAACFIKPENPAAITQNSIVLPMQTDPITHRRTSPSQAHLSRVCESITDRANDNCISNPHRIFTGESIKIHLHPKPATLHQSTAEQQRSQTSEVKKKLQDMITQDVLQHVHQTHRTL